MYRRADLLRTIVLVAALLPTAISTGASARDIAADDSRTIIKARQNDCGPAALGPGDAGAIGVFPCRRFRAEMEPAGGGDAARGCADNAWIKTMPARLVQHPCEVKRT